MKRAVIIVPTYKEYTNLKTLVPELFKIVKPIKTWDISILIVDDNSPDNTKQLIENLQLKYPKLYLISGKKEGLGKAYRRGYKYALYNLKPDYLFGMDADWQHNPNLIPKFIYEAEQGAEFIIGSRYIKGGSIPKGWALYRKFFSYFANNLVIRLGFMNFSIHDWTSGYRLISSKFIKKTLHEYHNLDGYTFQIAIVNQAIKNNLRIKEVPLKFEERKVGQSKIQIFNFVTHNLLYIFFNSSFIKFSVVGTIGAVIDFGISYIFITLQYAVWFSTVISAECAIVSNFMLNNFWSFSHKKISHTPSSYIRKFVLFNLVSLGSIIIQASLMHLATEMLGKTNWYIYKAIIIIVIIIPYSYIIYNKLVWKDIQKPL